MILLENVAAGNFRFFHVLRTEFGDVDPLFAALDFFFEDVDAQIIVHRKLA